MSEDEVTILVELVDEGTRCWRPVRASQLGGGMFRIAGEQSVPENERWAYGPGEIVWCEERAFSDGSRGLVVTGAVMAG